MATEGPIQTVLPIVEGGAALLKLSAPLWSPPRFCCAAHHGPAESCNVEVLLKSRSRSIKAAYRQGSTKFWSGNFKNPVFRRAMIMMTRHGNVALLATEQSQGPWLYVLCCRQVIFQVASSWLCTEQGIVATTYAEQIYQ
eukprot:8299540-Heterocapsa_arctica.AAC.1